MGCFGGILELPYLFHEFISLPVAFLPWDAATAINGWCAAILNGQCGPDHVATNGFFHSQEFINAQLNNDQFIDVLYHTFFGREPDPQGKADWLNALNNGATADDVIAGFCNSVEFANIKASFGL